MRQWQMEVVAGTVLRMDEWSYSHAHWLESRQHAWGLLLSGGKRRVVEYECLSLATRLKRRRKTHDGGPCVLVLTGGAGAGTLGSPANRIPKALVVTLCFACMVSCYAKHSISSTQTVFGTREMTKAGKHG